MGVKLVVEEVDVRAIVEIGVDVIVEVMFTCMTQSRKRRKTGAWLASPGVAWPCLVQKGCPARIHSLSIRAWRPWRVLVSGFRMIWARLEMTRLRSVPPVLSVSRTAACSL